jgi:hypothetical protein
MSSVFDIITPTNPKCYNAHLAESLVGRFTIKTTPLYTVILAV